jgi:hypothetical protein
MFINLSSRPLVFQNLAMLALESHMLEKIDYESQSIIEDFV